MAKVSLNELRRWLELTLARLGMTAPNAATVADTVMRATLRGVGHHDIYDFPGRLTGLRDGRLNANPEFRALSTFGALESWDGDNGLGELVCSFAMERAMGLADIHGMGLCAVRNSNHYMAAAPYVERASEAGYIGMLLCKGAPTMGAPGRTDKVIGTLPMGFAVPTDHGYPIMLDACMAYASFGVLRERMEKGEPVPAYWGFDRDGRPTEDPAALAQGTRLPIGGHKGFGIAILGEVLTALLSEGCIVDEIDGINGQAAPTSHTAIAIKVGALMDPERFRARSGELIDRMTARAPDLHVPGQGSFARKTAMLADGSVELKDALLDAFDAFCGECGFEKLARL